MAYRAAIYLCSGIVEEMNTSKSLPKWISTALWGTVSSTDIVSGPVAHANAASVEPSIIVPCLRDHYVPRALASADRTFKDDNRDGAKKKNPIVCPASVLFGLVASPCFALPGQGGKKIQIPVNKHWLPRLLTSSPFSPLPPPTCCPAACTCCRTSPITKHLLQPWGAAQSADGCRFKLIHRQGSGSTALIVPNEPVHS